MEGRDPSVNRLLLPFFALPRLSSSPSPRPLPLTTSPCRSSRPFVTAPVPSPLITSPSSSRPRPSRDNIIGRAHSYATPVSISRPSLTSPLHPSRPLSVPHVPSPSLTFPHHPSRSLTIPHVPSPSLTSPLRPSRPLSVPHVPSPSLASAGEHHRAGRRQVLAPVPRRPRRALGGGGGRGGVGRLFFGKEERGGRVGGRRWPHARARGGGGGKRAGGWQSSGMDGTWQWGDVTWEPCARQGGT